jgi:hypothetical protein
MAEKVALSLVLLGLLRAYAVLWGTTLYRYPDLPINHWQKDTQLYFPSGSRKKNAKGKLNAQKPSEGPGQRLQQVAHRVA